MSKKSASYLQAQEDPRFQNRKGPGGTNLDVDEAMAWFPDLIDAEAAEQYLIAAGDSVLVGYGDLRFWLHDVEVSVEAGVYFGDITEPLPANDESLDAHQNIGFERRHVFAVRKPDGGQMRPRRMTWR